MTTTPPGYAVYPPTPPATPAEPAPATTPAATTVPHVKFSLNAKGLLQYKLTLSYPTVAELMEHAIADAFAFECNARAVFLNLVPAAKGEARSGTAAD